MYLQALLTPQLETMSCFPIGFSLAEKFALVQALESVILADGAVHSGEINALSELMNRIDFDSNFIMQARNLTTDQSLLILNAMSSAKKEALVVILKEMAMADGFVHQKETVLMTSIFSSMGILQEQE